MRHDSFDEVYRRHVSGVYAFVAYRVCDTHAAEDLVQATFERALRAWHRFDPGRASERTWLFSIARNLIIDHWRRPREELSPNVEVQMDRRGGHEDSSPEVSDALLTALATLSDRDREVVALRFGGDLSAAEIAAITDLTLSNVQQILSRSLRRLRERVDRTSLV